MIRIDNLQIVFNPGGILEARALRGVNLNITAGEFVTVIGSNGAGKSTLLGALAGDFPPSSGAIHIDNADVSALPAHRRAAFVARVFQDPLSGTCAHLSIEENLSLAAARGSRRGLKFAVNEGKRAQFRRRLQMLEMGLENRLDDQVGKLSGGQRQALSLIMATFADSRILLLDEHTAALDPRMAAFVLELTRRVYEEYQLTVLMVTHSMQSALSLGRRTIMLHEGRIIHDLAGDARRDASVADLLRLFSASAGGGLDNDRLLLA